MPARSRAQQAAMAIAEHNPAKLQPQNRGLLNMSQPQLHDFAATPTSGLPRYVGKYAAGGDVAPPPPSLYGQGGEVDVSLPSQPQMPNTPSMEQNRTVGYAKGGEVAPESYAHDTADKVVRFRAAQLGIPEEQIPRLLRAVRDRSPYETPEDVIHRESLPSERYGEPRYGRGGSVGKRTGKTPAKFAKGGVVGGTDPQTESAKPPLRGRIKPKLSRAQRVAKFEQDNGDEEV